MILYLIFLIAGLLLCLYGTLWLRRLLTEVRHSERALGRVIRQEETKDSEGVVYVPIFAFTTSDNKNLEYRHSVSNSNPKAWSVGTEQTFIYNPAQPASARMLRYAIFNPVMILMGIAFVLVVTGGGYFLLQGCLS